MTLTFVVWTLVIAFQRPVGQCIRIDPSVDIGGDAGEREYPFMVQLQRYWVVSYLHECGGSLLAPSWILTAAHCNEHQPDLQALAGTVKRNDRTNGQRRAVVHFMGHASYVLNGSTGPFDIALARVEQPFDVDGVTVGTIGLPATGWHSGELPDDGLTVLGFGKIDQHDTLAAVLRTVAVRRRSPTECGTEPAPVGTICVGSPGSTACQGDSGGPVLGWNGAGVPHLVAVVSYGAEVCGAGPITCTDVAAYDEWIKETMSGEGMNI